MGLQRYLSKEPLHIPKYGAALSRPSLAIKSAHSHINRGDMKRVQVWLVNEESSRTVHEHFGQIVEAYIPSRERFLGECDAAPEAVAELADVEIEEAAEALSKLGELVLVGELYEGDVSAELYLMVLPVTLTAK
jgi:translation initiation factor 2 beta subunit (eIF-2beta)/eIF-5